MDKKIKNKFKKMFPIQLALVVTFAIFMPSSLFLGNPREFALKYMQIVPVILGGGIILFLVTGLIGRLLFGAERAYRIYLNLLLGITLGFYIQGNFLNGNLPQLDGMEVDWSKYNLAAMVSIVVWILCIVAPQMLAAGKTTKTLWEKAGKYGSYFLAAVQLSTLAVLILTQEVNTVNDFVVTNEGQFELASQKNIVVFVIDTLDAQWAEEYVLNDPLYRPIVEDFVYFDNVVSGGAPTQLGLPALFTGVTYDDPYEMSYDTYYEKAYGSSAFFKDFKEHDYAVRLYINRSYLSYVDAENVDNFRVHEGYILGNPIAFAGYLYRLTAYYAMPYPLKEFLRFPGGRFTRTLDIKGGEKYIVDDPQFYRDFMEHPLSVGEKERAFTYYHFNGAHMPYTMDENCEPLNDGSSTLAQQIHGTFKIIGEYMEEMRGLGLYDGSTIIIMADHGGVDLYQNPAVFIKRPHEAYDGEIVVNSAPAMFKNVRASIAAAYLDDYSAYGASLFDDVSENERNGRYHTAVGHLRTNCFSEELSGWEYDRYRIGNPARDTSLIEDVSPEVQQ